MAIHFSILLPLWGKTYVLEPECALWLLWSIEYRWLSNSFLAQTLWLAPFTSSIVKHWATMWNVHLPWGPPCSSKPKLANGNGLVGRQKPSQCQAIPGPRHSNHARLEPDVRVMKPFQTEAVPIPSATATTWESQARGSQLSSVNQQIHEI